MEKNYLTKVPLVVLAVVLVLLTMYWIPSFSVGGWSMRKVDLLSDVRSDSAVSQLIASDSTLAKVVENPDTAVNDGDELPDSVPPVLEGSHLTVDKKSGKLITMEDSIINAKAEVTETKSGVTSIIDMSDGASGGMAAFYEALAQAQYRPVRIAVIGDSFIEGDIMTSKLRELLQQRFGGKGVGYLPMTTITASFSRTCRQTFKGWTQHKAVDRSGYVDTYNNLTGNYFNASNGAWVNLAGLGSSYPHAGSCSSSTFYFLGGAGSGYVTAVVNGADSTYFPLSANGVVGHATVYGNIKNVKWVVREPGNMVFLGTSMDSENGVIVDNLAMRSSSGQHLSRVPASMMSAFNQARRYDLVIIMYGLNVAGHNNSAYTAYCKTVAGAINNIKNNMPGTSVLVVGCSDREERTSTGWHTMKGVLGLIQAQKRVAIDCNVAFWDLYSAMGGEGSIVQMVSRGEASKDYTHITYKGGDRIARYLYDALMLGYENR